MKNSAVFFVHGGPGLSSSYFNGWFTEIEKNFDLLFYDQNYNIPKNISAIDFLADELLSKLCLAIKNYENIIIYAHSWGVFLTLHAFNRTDFTTFFDKIEKIIFSNPSDSNWESFCSSGDKLFSKMSTKKLSEISKCTNGIQLMNLALPYYLGNSEVVPNIVIDRYDINAYDRISAEMDGYDVSDIIKKLPKEKTFTIYCDNDFEQTSGSPEFLRCSNVHYFPKAGHFPFAEYPESYIKLLCKILS